MKRPVPSEREAWLEAIRLFDEAHDELLKELKKLEDHKERQENSGRP